MFIVSFWVLDAGCCKCTVLAGRVGIGYCLDVVQNHRFLCLVSKCLILLFIFWGLVCFQSGGLVLLCFTLTCVTSHNNLLFIAVFLIAQFAVHSFPLAISLKLPVPFDNMPLMFASYDCKTLLRAILKKNFINSLFQLLRCDCCVPDSIS